MEGYYIFSQVCLGRVRLHVRDANDQALPKRPRGATHGIERHGSISGIEKAIQLRSAGAELLGHGLLGFLLTFHLLFQLPGQYTLNCNGFDLFTDAFFFQKTIES
jgi:hypothetical protein